MILQGISLSDIRAATRLVARILKEYPDRTIISTAVLEERILARSPPWYVMRGQILRTNLLTNAMERNGWAPWNPARRNYRITAWVRPEVQVTQPVVVLR